MNKQYKTIVSISDIHMGALDPAYMYNTLREQFINKIYNLDFDILAICGDLFDSKFMSNNPVISYTMMLIADLVSLCKMKNATLLLLDGTLSHDNGQLSMFYYYMHEPGLDFRVIENIQFEDVKGTRVLCIPEKYGISEDIYKNVLFESGSYDLCILHGTYKGSFRGSEIATLKSNHAPVFSMDSFINCRGPILMGHYHISGCYDGYAYYHGSALRFCFGEEQTKGFLVTVMDSDSRYHYTQLVPIDSYIYNTININSIINSDPKEIIEHIKKVKESRGIDFIRVQYNNTNDNMNVVKGYFRNNPNVKLQELDVKDKQMQQIDQTIIEQNTQYSYILDKNISDYDKFVMYTNQNMGYDFITVDELINILEDKL